MLNMGSLIAHRPYSVLSVVIRSRDRDGWAGLGRAASARDCSLKPCLLEGTLGCWEQEGRVGQLPCMAPPPALVL